jgi:hypothetical protein
MIVARGQPWCLAIVTSYKLFLIRAYAHGDLGDLAQVDPLARGTAPLLVALVGAALPGAAMVPWRATAVCSIGIGGHRHGRMRDSLHDGRYHRRAGGGLGFRLHPLDVLGRRNQHSRFAPLSRGQAALRAVAPAWCSGLAAGALSLGSYWIAIAPAFECFVIL